MKRFTISVLFGSLLAIGWILGGDVATSAAQSAESRMGRTEGISGQGKMRFRVLYTSDHLPAEAQKVLTKAHGGFAIDRRDGKGENLFRTAWSGNHSDQRRYEECSHVGYPGRNEGHEHPQHHDLVCIGWRRFSQFRGQ